MTPAARAVEYADGQPLANATSPASKRSVTWRSSNVVTACGATPPVTSPRRNRRARSDCGESMAERVPAPSSTRPPASVITSVQTQVRPS